MDFSIEALSQLPVLAAVAQYGKLFQVGQLLTATALANANFVLFNGSNRGLPVIVTAIIVQATAAMEVDLFRLDADPAIGAGNVPQNMLLGSIPPASTFEAAVAVAPGNDGQLAAIEASSNPTSLLPEGAIFIPTGKGILISSATVAGNVALTLQFAELGAEFDGYLADRE